MTTTTLNVVGREHVIDVVNTPLYRFKHQVHRRDSLSDARDPRRVLYYERQRSVLQQLIELCVCVQFHRIQLQNQKKLDLAKSRLPNLTGLIRKTKCNFMKKKLLNRRRRMIRFCLSPVKEEGSIRFTLD